MRSGSPELCHLGPDTGFRKRILAIGDSHNNTLIGVYDYLAIHNHWRVDVNGMGGCYLTTRRQRQPSSAMATGCAQWQRMITEIANRGNYDAIIVTHSSTDRLIIATGSESIETATTNGLVSAWSGLPKIPIIAIRDNPIPRSDVIQCVTQHKSAAANQCAVQRSTALHFDGQAEAARIVRNARVVDVTDLYCTPTICPPVIGNVLVYRDPSHITATYAATLAPYLTQRITAAIDS